MLGATTLLAGEIPPRCWFDCPEDAAPLRRGFWVPTAGLAAGARF